MVEIIDRYSRFGKNLLKITSFVLGYKDVFSLEKLITLIHEWLVEEGYATRDDEKFGEVFYLQKDNPVAGNEYWIRWRLEKTPFQTKLWKYLLDIDIHVLGLKKVELVAGGKKLEADKGKVEIAADFGLLLDPQNLLEAPVIKPFKMLVLKGFLKAQFSKHKEAVFTDAQRLQDMLKSYLRLETYLTEKEIGRAHV